MPFTSDADDRRRPGARRPSRGPPGFFSKDEILVFAAERGGFYWIFAIGGYIGAFLTAIYAFRIVFRVFWGEPCPEARELEQGHLAHAEPQNPMTGETEDTDVGFPGAGAPHRRARLADGGRRWRCWASARSSAAMVQIPGVDDVIDNVPAPTFVDSPLSRAVPVDRRRLGGARGRRGARRARDRHRLLRLRGRRPRHRRARCAGAARRRPHLPGQQVVLRRALRRARLPAGDRDRAVRQRRRRAGRRPGDRRRGGRRRARGRAWSCAAPSRASCAPMRCCWWAASPPSASTS